MKRVFIIGLLLTFALTGMVAAQQGHGQKKCCDDRPYHGMKKEGIHKGFGVERILKIADEINLTDDQKDKLKSMATEFQLKKVDLEAEIEKGNILLRDLMHDESASESDVFKTIDRVTAFKADMKKMHYSHMKSAKNVLTNEQKEKLESLRKEHMEKRGVRKFGLKQNSK